MLCFETLLGLGMSVNGSGILDWNVQPLAIALVGTGSPLPPGSEKPYLVVGDKDESLRFLALQVRSAKFNFTFQIMFLSYILS